MVKGVISIHTTTRVVTQKAEPITWKSGDFNPHHYESGDEFVPFKITFIVYFNPHHYESGDSKNTQKFYL